MNTRYALTTTLASGTYYWRARAATATASGAWSAVRSFTVDWSDVPLPQSPAMDANLTYPSALLLNWSGVKGAQTYQLTIAKDPDLQSIVDGYPTADEPTTTAATAYSPGTRLATGDYYWSVTPIDAEGNQGTASPVFHFHWQQWPNAPTLTVTDLDPSTEVYDPQFSWTPVQGAAKYQVEVNSDPNWATGSKVCCSGFTIATALTPAALLPADTYYWRVRPYDASGNPGPWTRYTDGAASPVDTFTISYDSGLGSVHNLSMRDAQDQVIPWVPGGVSTEVPIVSWDPVPGASSYEVDVTPFNDVSAPNACDYTANSMVQWDVLTAATSWTPLGADWNTPKPFPNAHNVAQDGATALTVGGQYCVRVTAQRNNDTNGHVVYGDPSYIGPSGGTDASFTFTKYPDGGSCSPSCATGYLGANDYLLPQTGSSNARMPLFTWNPIAGKQSYFVIVATDPSFQNVVDYAFTQVPAYAPRTTLGSWTTYKDTNSLYYWAVLPANAYDGAGAVGDPITSAAKQNFQKASTPPSLLTPSIGATITSQPNFQWTPVEGAYYYHLQVASDPEFGNILEEVGTNTVDAIEESSYSSNTTYPADQELYWRVQAVDRAGTGLAWSDTGTFTKTLPVPSFSGITAPYNATSSDVIPMWEWNAVPGAVSYDVHLVCPITMSCQDGTNRDSTAAVLIHQSGILPFKWQVRANFPTANGTIHGVYTPLQSFQRAIAPPAGEANVGTGTHSFSFAWTPKPGAKQYVVQVATSQATSSDGSFASSVETITTDNATAAPTLMSFGTTSYEAGGTLYWHVAIKDADGNTGAYSAPMAFKLPVKAILTSTVSYFVHGTTKTVTVTAKDSKNHALSGVSIKVSGAGVTVTSKKTGSGGKVTFKIHPKKSGGKVTFTGTKSGLQTGTLVVSVL